MINARILYIDKTSDARDEILKIGVDRVSIPWLSVKAVHINMKIENVPAFAANIIKQEMLGKGGDTAVNRGVVNCSVKSSDLLVMGTISQYKKLIEKLNMQPGILKEISVKIRELLDNLEGNRPKYLKCRRYELPMGLKTYVMGILNVTPDSFSDGGRYPNVVSAVNRAKEMIEEGADIIDIGGESTRPGHDPVDFAEEVNRVIPVVEKLRNEAAVPISVDTSKAVVAERALQAGADMINDVWGLQGDSAMADTVARYGAGIVMMHNRKEKAYIDLMGDIVGFLAQSIEIADKAGIRRESMVIDPGIGFGKMQEHNIEVMRRLKELNSLNLPILLGTSRKSFIGSILDLPVSERKEGTSATVVLGVAAGVDIVRVHDVREIKRAVKMADAIVRNGA